MQIRSGHRNSLSQVLFHVGTSYTAAVARVVSWLIVSAIVFRRGGAEQLALLMLVRGTIGLLSYVSLGLGPALIHHLSKGATGSELSFVMSGDLKNPVSSGPDHSRKAQSIFLHALILSVIAGVLGVGMVVVYGVCFSTIHENHPSWQGLTFPVVVLMGAGLVIRLVSDVFGAGLQADHRIGRDSIFQIITEGIFVFGVVWLAYAPVIAAAGAFFMANSVLLCGRFLLCRNVLKEKWSGFDPTIAKMLLTSGTFVLIAQLADWFYAPVNQILIEQYLSVEALAVYVPALQVDSALLLLVSGVSVVMLPYAAQAMREHDYPRLRRIYISGTMFALCVLSAAAVVVVWQAEWLFTRWFGDSLPMTRAILPWILIHTIIGASALPARAVMLGMGHFKAYTISALVGGVSNLILAVTFLHTTSWGIRSVIYATILTVGIRCLIWMPIYVLTITDPNREKKSP